MPVIDPIIPDPIPIILPDLNVVEIDTLTPVEAIALRLELVEAKTLTVVSRSKRRQLRINAYKEVNP